MTKTLGQNQLNRAEDNKEFNISKIPCTYETLMTLDGPQ